MDRLEELRRLRRKDEYAEEEQKKNTLNEAATAFHNGLSNKFYEKQAPLRRIKAECDFTKAVICEAVCNLYESALVIDDVEKYSNSLRKAMTDQCMSIMENANNTKDLAMMFENASPYIKGLITLAEAAFNEKDEEDIKAFEDKVVLSKEDMNFIDKFEAEEGKDVYATGLQDRVIDVYKEEEKLGEEQRDRVQAVVDELSKLKSTGADKSDETDVVTESIESGSKLFNTTPKTLFSAIFINKSKASMNESASADLAENGEQILAETIATYTLLETIHALGIKSYTEKEVNDLKMEFFIS